MTSPLPASPYSIAREECVRHFQRYTSNERANHAASHRLTPGQRESTGFAFWTHPSFPGISFPTRSACVDRAVLAAESRAL